MKSPWQDKTVWTISYIQSQPGRFDEYIRDLSDLWRKYIERGMKDGRILSYKIFNVPFPGDNQPDLMLLVEYKNMAAFDTGSDHADGIFNEIAGSVEVANTAAVSREALRKVRGVVLAREIDFRV